MNAREKIRQFVIMARHPEAKNYDEGLKNEKKYKNCLYEFNPCQIVSPIGEYILDKNLQKIESEIGIVYKMYNYFYQYLTTKKIREKHTIEIKQIIGRPITALDVCWALNKKHNENKCYFDLKLYTIHNRPMQSILIDKEKSDIIYLEAIKPDGIYTTLDDWDDEVCEKIAELI